MSQESFDRSLNNLPQGLETWLFSVRHLHIWITPDDEPSVRPYIAIMLNMDNQMIQAYDLLPEDFNNEQLIDVIFAAMSEPFPELGLRPQRPRMIQFERADIMADLGPSLQDIGVDVEEIPVSEVVDGVVVGLENTLRGGAPVLPSLLSVKGVTPDLFKGLFLAASEFYRAAPWVHLDDEHPIAITVQPQRKARYAVVMGNAGIQYGLAMYQKWEDFVRLFGPVESSLESLPTGGSNSLIFEDITFVPFDDLEAIERFGLEVVDDQAYPVPIVYTRRGGAKRPTRARLSWFEAASRAIPLFLRDHLKSDGGDGYLPAEAVITIPTHKGEVDVKLEYPAGAIPKESRAVDVFDWIEIDAEDELDFDPRSMEGVLSDALGGVGDTPLDQDQDLMYTAWEESNPARRIILAHQALSISPDCADAYVLLAEEEADTLGRSMELYRQGLKAGERAIGKEGFKDFEGHFWGLMETRPYMRARHGLANCLVTLGREDEAIKHYQEMLRLNPGDNQGIRYILASVYLEYDHDEELKKLLTQFEDDYSATWFYTSALLTFRQGGSSAGADASLAAALAYNPYVPDYLVGRQRIPARLPEYHGIGDEREALFYAAENLNSWRRTHGAIKWLKDNLT